ncbi:MAG: inositol monophosphatase family protein [Candidatus Nitrosocosmicus sp.]|uniref:inositol monophosphatase family protein n=1 Tax=Candidatus Nitrosocosmicus agrestis TaxID=2563600 RepID=UPI001E58C5CE|nr:inositol monophosphatase family protein [Candidatus Nitrosocosmicus sp. SS]
MSILNILKECAIAVFDDTKDIVGTIEGKEKFNVGAGGDISTRIDLKAESAVFETLKKNGFKPTIIGEECGVVEGNDNGFIIMDGIDGTTNANSGLPFYCCSLAYSPDIHLASVTDSVVFNLATGDMFYAVKSQGSFMNDIRIHVAKDYSAPINDMVIGLNISGLSEIHFGSISKLVSSVSHIRHLGANALELCYFARGSINAYIDIRDKIRAIDMAACYLIAKEAGGLIFDISGNVLNCNLSVDSRMSFIAVGNEKMYGWITSLLKLPD